MCDRLIKEEEEVCPICLRTLPKTEQWTHRDNITEGIIGQLPHFYRAAAYLYYKKDSAVKKLIHRFKYSQYARPEIAYYIGREAATDILHSDFFDNINTIIPMPLHPRRYRQRGFNQSEWIANGLSSITSIPVNLQYVHRIKNNPQQALQSGKKREENVKNIFNVQYPEQLFRKHILLVDDIITTGSTIRSCIEALRVCRGCKISVFVLGIAS